MALTDSVLTGRTIAYGDGSSAELKVQGEQRRDGSTQVVGQACTPASRTGAATKPSCSDAEPLREGTRK